MILFVFRDNLKPLINNLNIFIFLLYFIDIYFKKQLNKYIIEGYGEGDYVDHNKHDHKVEIKGITYHEMKIFKEQNKDKFIVEYIVDL